MAGVLVGEPPAKGRSVLDRVPARDSGGATREPAETDPETTGPTRGPTPADAHGPLAAWSLSADPILPGVPGNPGDQHPRIPAARRGAGAARPGAVRSSDEFLSAR